MGAFYSSRISEFLSDDDLKISGSLLNEEGLYGFYDHKHTQTFSWTDEIKLLKSAFLTVTNQLPRALDWALLLEYPIARRNKRIDSIILADDIIIVIEFKVGKANYSGSD